jgi:predicted acylesterase/phospholipase RssA
VPEETIYDQLVFSGGGTRCFWFGGFTHVLRRARPLHPARITGVSGGALSSVSFITHRGPRLLDTMCAAFSQQDHNFGWHDAIDGEHGYTPHQRVYREVVASVVDAEAQAIVADGPALQILIAHPPDHDWEKLSGTAMTAAYEADLHIRSTPHLAWSQKAGLTTTRVDGRQAARDGTLVDLICAAATIPPVFEPPTWDGKPVIDAGMADQAPMPEPNLGSTLILLTRRYRNIPDVPGRRYVMPSEEVPADKIDFTDPEKLRRTWDLGESDAHDFIATLQS